MTSRVRYLEEAQDLALATTSPDQRSLAFLELINAYICSDPQKVRDLFSLVSGPEFIDDRAHASICLYLCHREERALQAALQGIEETKVQDPELADVMRQDLEEGLKKPAEHWLRWYLFERRASVRTDQELLRHRRKHYERLCAMNAPQFLIGMQLCLLAELGDKPAKAQARILAAENPHIASKLSLSLMNYHLRSHHLEEAKVELASITALEDRIEALCTLALYLEARASVTN